MRWSLAEMGLVLVIYKRILWVEDDLDIISLVVSPLVDLGFQIVGCRNYAEALAQVKNLNQVDLILLDLILPPGDHSANNDYLGLVFLRQLRGEFDIQVPVLVFSVIAGVPEIDNELHELNAFPLVKPIRPSQLKETVLQLLSLSDDQLLTSS